MMSRRDFFKTCAVGVAALVCFPQRLFASAPADETITVRLEQGRLKRAITQFETKDGNIFHITGSTSITPAPSLKLEYVHIYFASKDRIMFMSDGNTWHEVGRA